MLLVDLGNEAKMWLIRRYPHAKPYLVGGQGMPIETFFATQAQDLL